MAAAIAVADLTVCRSGAMTVAEITAAGLPAIYVPLPHGNGEQALNSQPVVDAGGAVMIPDAELDGQRLTEEVMQIARDPHRREEMVAAAESSGAGDVSKMLADRIAADVSREQEKDCNYVITPIELSRVHMIGIGGAGLYGLRQRLLS